MSKFIAAIVAAVTLLGAAKSQACESLAFVAPSYAAPVRARLEVAQPVYVPTVVALEVADVHYSQQIQFRQQVNHCGQKQQFRTPVRSVLRGGRCR